MATTFKNLDIKDLTPDEFNVRKDDWNPNDDDEQKLVDSIKTQGVLEPILVRPIKGQPSKYPKNKVYSIVCGARRYRASMEARHKTMPAVIRDDLDDVSALVDGVTKLSKLPRVSRADLPTEDEGNEEIESFPQSSAKDKSRHKDLKTETLRKTLMAMGDDVRVVLIKLADRLHNMRTLGSMPRDKQLKIANETIFIYAPLAHRLGLYAFKSELEDLYLKYTDEETYNEIARKINASKDVRDKFIRNFIKPIKEELNRHDFTCTIKGRPKSIHSILNKMKNVDVKLFEKVIQAC